MSTRQKFDHYFDLGQNFLNEGKISDAIESFLKAIEIDPSKAKSYYYIAKSYSQKGNHKEAIDYLKKAFKTNSYEIAAITDNLYFFYFPLASCYFEIGEDDEAEKYFKKAIEINSERIEPYNNLSFLLTKQGRDEEAVSILEKAQNIDPDSKLIKKNLSIVLVAMVNKDIERDDWGRACVNIWKAYLLDPKNETAAKLFKTYLESTRENFLDHPEKFQLSTEVNNIINSLISNDRETIIEAIIKIREDGLKTEWQQMILAIFLTPFINKDDIFLRFLAWTAMAYRSEIIGDDLISSLMDFAEGKKLEVNQNDVAKWCGPDGIVGDSLRALDFVKKDKVTKRKN